MIFLIFFFFTIFGLSMEVVGKDFTPTPQPPLKDNTRNGDADVNMRSLWQREIRWYNRKLRQSFIL